MLAALISRIKTPQPLSLSLTCNADGVAAKAETGKLTIAPEEWFTSGHPWRPADRDQAMWWRRMLEHGVQKKADEYWWPHEAIAQLPSETLDLVLTRPRLPFLPFLTASHHLRHADLSYTLSFQDNRGLTVPLLVSGAIARLSADFWVLPEALRSVLLILREKRPPATEAALRFVESQRLKLLMQQVGGRWDDYLNNQEVIGLDSLQFDVQDDGNELQIIPHADNLPAGITLEQLASQFSRIQDDYPLAPRAGKVTRVVPSQSVKEALTEWRQIRRLTGTRRKQFLQRPRAFLTQSAIDWKHFDRQLELLREAEPDTPLPALPELPVLHSEATRNIQLDWVEAAEAPELAASGVIQPIREFPPAELPPTLRPHVELLQHQKDGLGWLQALCLEGREGALLADDMGLGKTLQTLCFVEWNRLRAGGSSLIIAPVVLLQNWKREYLAFFSGDQAIKEADILILHGESLQTLKSGRRLDLQKLVSSSLVITTYDVLRSQALELEKVQWTTIIVDEAQNIKNPAAQISIAAGQLRAAFRIAATGTPVENGLQDLWALLNFAQPGCLGSKKAFLAEYRCQTTEEMQEVCERLQERIEPLYLRRMKKDLLKDLPRKIEHVVSLKMTNKQAATYASLLVEIREQRRGGLAESFKLSRVSAWCGQPHDEVDEAAKDSCKMVWLFEQLEKIRKAGDKALIFADIIDIQNVLVLMVERRFRIPVEVINGETGTSQASSGREAILARFRGKPGFGVIVLSPKAAGVGLTIVEANHVIHFTRLWNPAREDQATDRAYRIGQTKEVHVYYPLAEHPEVPSFDSYLNERLQRKRDLADTALFPALLKEFGSEDMQGFLAGSLVSEIAELPVWLRVVRKARDFASLEDYLGALESSGISLLKLSPRVARVRQFDDEALASLAGSSDSPFWNPLPDDAEAASLPIGDGGWSLLLKHGLDEGREIEFCSHHLVHRALGHLSRSDQRGHWDRWVDITQPERRWDREVQQWVGSMPGGAGHAV